MGKIETVKVQVGEVRAGSDGEEVFLVWLGFRDTGTTTFKGSAKEVRDRLRDAIKALHLIDKVMQVSLDDE